MFVPINLQGINGWDPREGNVDRCEQLPLLPQANTYL